MSVRTLEILKIDPVSPDLVIELKIDTLNLWKLIVVKHAELQSTFTPVGPPLPTKRELVGNVAVFGANGFIGKQLIQSIASRGYNVRALSRRFEVDYEPPEGVEQIRADLLDFVSVTRALEGVTTVVQLANNINPASGNARLVNDLEQELVTQVRFLEACLLAGVKRVVFPSSGGAVYGQLQYSPVDEKHPTFPVSSYGMTKLAMERYLHLFRVSHGLSYVVVRISNPYGPGQVFRRGQGLIPQVIERVKNGQPAVVFGNGEATRDFVFIGDLVEGITKAIEKPEAVDKTINLASGTSKSVMDVVQTISELLGREIAIQRMPARETDVTRNCLDVTLAKRFWTGRRRRLSAKECAKLWRPMDCNFVLRSLRCGARLGQTGIFNPVTPTGPTWFRQFGVPITSRNLN